MAFVFPELKDDFTAPNGITYSWLDDRWIVRSFKTPGGNEVIVSEDPPLNAAVGDLWYCSKPDDLTLYILVEAPDVWAAASPPVSLDGIEGDISMLEDNVQYIQKNMTPFEAHQELYGKVEEIEEAVDTGLREQTQLRGRIGDTEFAVGRKVDLYGTNIVEPNGGQWRIKGAGRTFIKVDTNAGTCGVFNLQEPTEDHHAPSRGWVKNNTVQLKGENTVSSGWKVQTSDKTHLHVEGGTTRIYYLQEPSHAQHPVTLQYADATYAKTADIDNSISSLVCYQKFFAKPQESGLVGDRKIYYTLDGDKVVINASLNTYQDPFQRFIDLEDMKDTTYEVDFGMHRVGRLPNKHLNWELIMAGKTQKIKVATLSSTGRRYISITFDKSECLVWRPEQFENSNDDTNNADSNYVNFQIGSIFRY